MDEGMLTTAEQNWQRVFWRLDQREVHMRRKHRFWCSEVFTMDEGMLTTAEQNWQRVFWRLDQREVHMRRAVLLDFGRRGSSTSRKVRERMRGELEQMLGCNHPALCLTRGANQYASWTRCSKCRALIQYKHKKGEAPKEEEDHRRPSRGAQKAEEPRLQVRAQTLDEMDAEAKQDKKDHTTRTKKNPTTTVNKHDQLLEQLINLQEQSLGKQDKLLEMMGGKGQVLSGWVAAECL